MLSLRSPAWATVTYWALDLETTGLDERRDRVVAVGMLPIRAAVIRWGERYQSLLRPPEGSPAARGAGTGIAAHHILPSEIAEAPPFAQVIGEVSARLEERGAALLCHFASVDVPFLRRAFREAGRSLPRLPVVDTAKLLGKLDRQRRFVDAHAAELPTALGEARRALDLPPHQAHDALSDALATAELMLALRSRLDARTLRDLT